MCVYSDHNDFGTPARENADQGVASALKSLRDNLASLRFPLNVSSSHGAVAVRDDALNQLDDYVLPRYEALDAPLLAVIGGSTGAGKSTLLNSILGENVTRASALRPTTRRPLLTHNPADAVWFDNDRILPKLARVRSDGRDESLDVGTAITELRLATCELLPAGLALLDSPDIDSVVTENRELANQLLAAGDLWVFVTTAARYADAIPWAMLDEAAARNIVVAVVLNRVPAGVGAEVRADLARRLESRGLGRSPLFVISEKELDSSGRLPEDDVAPIRSWLQEIAHDASARASVARQTLRGAVATLAQQSDFIVSAYAQQIDAVESLRKNAHVEFNNARIEVVMHSTDGSVLRGEVLERWQDVVGTGAWMRKLENGVSRIRDRIASFIGAKTVDTSGVEVALEQGIYEMLVNSAEVAHSSVAEQWLRVSGAHELLSDARLNIRDDAERDSVARSLVHGWQNDVLSMIREQGESKKFTARMLSFGVNAVGVALMIFVFANTGGLVGGEVAVAGGTAVVAQRVLEAVFGEDAVRRMAQKARTSLEDRIEDFFADEANAYDLALDSSGVGAETAERLRQAYVDLDKARERERELYL